MRLSGLFFAALAAGAVAGASHAAAAVAPSARPALLSIKRFDGVVSIGAATRVHVTIRDVTVFAQRVTTTIPTTGFTVAHLLAGRASSTESGRTTVRRSGAFWSVKAGTPLEVTVLGETATFEIVESRPVP